jgi:hypothetical protein
MGAKGGKKEGEAVFAFFARHQVGKCGVGVD